ncbi:MAG: GNAT family N-acetyltransferase [Burkholderiales bacterium]|nr:GNAT family N-acetyltransferase [Burkholderiales bacterium]
MPQSYPEHLVKVVTLADGAAITIRPIRPEDADIEAEFVRNLSDESRYYRFMDTLRELSPQVLSRFTRVDYDRHMALLAVSTADGRETQIAVARYVIADDGVSCEFAIVVADAWQRRGVGSHLMYALVDAARRRGLRRMFGEVLAGNHKMLALAQRLGFKAAFDPDDRRMMRVELKL